VRIRPDRRTDRRLIGESALVLISGNDGKPGAAFGGKNPRSVEIDLCRELFKSPVFARLWKPACKRMSH
jgi:hypothetical protein